MKPPSNPADELRGQYLSLCEELIQYAISMRNYAMKPGNAWLARGELSKLATLIDDLETMLDAIKQADEAAA